MVMKIHIYVKSRNGKVKIQRAEIEFDGITVKLDPKRDLLYDKSRIIAFRNPLFNVTLPLHSYFVVYHYHQP